MIENEKSVNYNKILEKILSDIFFLLIISLYIGLLAEFLISEFLLAKQFFLAIYILMTVDLLILNQIGTKNNEEESDNFEPKIPKILALVFIPLIFLSSLRISWQLSIFLSILALIVLKLLIPKKS